MNRRCIAAIARRDAVAAVRNNLLLLALIAGVLFALVYYVLPSSVEETFMLAVYDKGDSQLLAELAESDEEGVYVGMFMSEEEVRKAVEKEEYMVGIVYPEDFDATVMSGQKPNIILYFKSDQPESMRTSVEYLMQLFIEFAIAGDMSFDIEEEILGEDMAGRHIPLREQSLPLYLLMALMMEMWTISTLIVEESAAGTLKAVLVTPASPADVILAKGTVGISYSLTVGLAVLILTWSIRGNIPVLFLGILLGAIMAVTLGLFLGSLTEDIVGSYAYVGAPFLVLMLPALLIFIPDVSLSIVKAIPTYYLVDAFNQILNHGAGLAEVWKNFAVIGLCDVTFLVLGVYALRRRYS
jgi:ABC-2 type transport system permease protein